MSSFPTSLTLNTFLLALVVLMAARVRQKTTLGRAALAGLVLGLAVLTRQILVGVLPILLVWLWLNAPPKRMQVIKAGATVAAVALITVLPWTVRNYVVHGRVVLISTHGGMTFWNGNNPFTTGSGHEVYTDLVAEYRGEPRDPELPEIMEMRPYPLPEDLEAQLSTISEVDLDRRLYHAGLQFVRQNPGRWSALAMEKLKGFLWIRMNVGTKYEASWSRYYTLMYAALLCLAVPGLVLSLRRWRDYLLLYLLIAYYTLTFVAFNVQMRYRWEIELYLVVFAAVTIAFLLERVPWFRRAPPVGGT
jgi:hypothetical protein